MRHISGVPLTVRGLPARDVFSSRAFFVIEAFANMPYVKNQRMAAGNTESEANGVTGVGCHITNLRVFEMTVWSDLSAASARPLDLF